MESLCAIATHKIAVRPVQRIKAKASRASVPRIEIDQAGRLDAATADGPMTGDDAGS